MKGNLLEELFRTNDPVALSVARARLSESGMEFFIADEFASMMDGSIGAIPRRVLVDEDRIAEARKLLADVLGDED